MSKSSLNTLKERAESVASEDLLNSISGGIENACHDYDASREGVDEDGMSIIEGAATMLYLAWKAISL